jgi:hypothetical protein
MASLSPRPRVAHCTLLLSTIMLYSILSLLLHASLLPSSSSYTLAEAARRTASLPMGANARRTASEDVLSSAILTNPSQDVHPLLTSQELALWSFLDEPSVAGPSYALSPSSSSSTLDEILKRLRAFEDVIYVNVRLVGFDGDGEQGLDISEARPSRSCCYSNPLRCLCCCVHSCAYT